MDACIPCFVALNVDGRLLIFGGFNGKKHLKTVEAFNEEIGEAAKMDHGIVFFDFLYVLGCSCLAESALVHV